MNISKAFVKPSLYPLVSFSLALALSHLVKWHILRKPQEVWLSSLLKNYILFSGQLCFMLCNNQMHFHVFNKNVSSPFSALDTWTQKINRSVISPPHLWFTPNWMSSLCFCSSHRCHRERAESLLAELLVSWQLEDPTLSSASYRSKSNRTSKCLWTRKAWGALQIALWYTVCLLDLELNRS